VLAVKQTSSKPIACGSLEAEAWKCVSMECGERVAGVCTGTHWCSPAGQQTPQHHLQTGTPGSGNSNTASRQKYSLALAGSITVEHSWNLKAGQTCSLHCHAARPSCCTCLSYLWRNPHFRWSTPQATSQTWPVQGEDSPQLWVPSQQMHAHIYPESITPSQGPKASCSPALARLQHLPQASLNPAVSSSA